MTLRRSKQIPMSVEFDAIDLDHINSALRQLDKLYDNHFIRVRGLMVVGDKLAGVVHLDANENYVIEWTR